MLFNYLKIFTAIYFHTELDMIRKVSEERKSVEKEQLNPNVISYWAESIDDENGFSWQVTVASTQKGLCWVGLGKPEQEEEILKAKIKRWNPQTVLIRRRSPNEKVLAELGEYFAGNRKEFTIPLDSIGTPFQLRVWEELRKIPYGETRNYGEIAREIGNPKGQRAVGLANNKNPIGIIVPCHRVIGKSGALVGYAGGVDLKERLLKLEAHKKS